MKSVIWDNAQHEEATWWGNCSNTIWEELKQVVYARHMGLQHIWDKNGPYNIAKDNLDILDIGGGPTSMLLKTTTTGSKVVVDPCDYPNWVHARYEQCGIAYQKMTGEAITEVSLFDEVWIYNVLQHTRSPKLIIQNALTALKPNGVLRIFEWIDHPTDIAHPHMLTKELLEVWLGQSGKTTVLSESGCHGKVFYGQFKKEVVS